jgi:glucose/arabinose dehydrogenase
MNKILTITLSLMLCMVLALAAGCTQPATPPPVATPAPTTVETTATPAPTPIPTKLSLTPGPTQALPDMWSLDVQVASNGEAIDPQIITSCQGGKGLNFIQQIDVRVTRSDGVVENGIIAKPLYKGKSVSLRSTTEYRDRAEVWATTQQGEKVKIFDDYVCFRCY